MTRVAELLRDKGSHVLMVAPETAVARVAQRMRQLDVGAFVVSSDGSHIDGLITERSIVAGVAHHGPDALDFPASALMTVHVETCGPRDSVRSAMATMTRARVRHLPVLEYGQLRGVISIGDLVKACLDDADLETSVLRDAYLTLRSR